MAKKTSAAAKRASELVNEERRRRAKPCIVGASKNLDVITEVVKRAGSNWKFVEVVVQNGLGEQLGDQSIQKHFGLKACRCFLGDPYRGYAPTVER